MNHEHDQLTHSISQIHNTYKQPRNNPGKALTARASRNKYYANRNGYTPFPYPLPTFLMLKYEEFPRVTVSGHPATPSGFNPPRIIR